MESLNICLRVKTWDTLIGLLEKQRIATSLSWYSKILSGLYYLIRENFKIKARQSHWQAPKFYVYLAVDEMIFIVSKVTQTRLKMNWKRDKYNLHLKPTLSKQKISNFTNIFAKKRHFDRPVVANFFKSHFQSIKYFTNLWTKFSIDSRIITVIKL